MPGDIIDISDDEDTVIRPLRMAKTMQSSKVENLPVAVSDDEDDAFIGSQATDPPSSQDCHIIISDTDSDDDASAPSWSREAKGKARQHSPLPPSSPPNERDSDFDFDYEDDDDDELPDPSKIVGYTSSSPRKRALSSGSSAFMARDEGHSSSSSSGRRSSTSVSRPTKKRKTSEQRDAERAKKDEEKSRKKADEAIQKSQSARLKAQTAQQTKERKEMEKAEKKRQQEEEKASKQAMKAANKLVNDKKETLKEMDLVFSTNFARNSPELVQAVRNHPLISEYNLEIRERDLDCGALQVIRWERRVQKRYNTQERIWEPCELFIKTERLVLLYITGRELFQISRRGELHGVIDTIRGLSALNKHNDKIFIMIRGQPDDVKNRMELDMALAKLQVVKHTFHLRVNKDSEAAQKIYDLSADLGIKPYKFVERSHLPFCSNVGLDKGKCETEIWPKMLAQVYRVTNSAASGVVREYATLGTLFKEYEREDQLRKRELLLNNCVVDERVDGQPSRRPLGQALSTRIHTALFGLDHLELVSKDAK